MSGFSNPCYSPLCSLFFLSMSLFQAFFDLIGYEKPINKGDIFVVEHEDGEVFRIIFKDDDEALKRWDFFDDLI